MKRIILLITFGLFSFTVENCQADENAETLLVGTTLAAEVPEVDPQEKSVQIPTDDAANSWRRKPILETRVDIRESHAVAPADRSFELDYGMDDWSGFHASPKVFAWAAPDIRYQPLFFEDVALERYGQTLGTHMQPYRSCIHFYSSIFWLPNHIWHDHPHSCDYPLGFCRPGSCAPRTKQIQYYGISRRE